MVTQKNGAVNYNVYCPNCGGKLGLSLSSQPWFEQCPRETNEAASPVVAVPAGPPKAAANTELRLLLQDMVREAVVFSGRSERHEMTQHEFENKVHAFMKKAIRGLELLDAQLNGGVASEAETAAVAERLPAS